MQNLKKRASALAETEEPLFLFTVKRTRLVLIKKSVQKFQPQLDFMLHTTQGVFHTTGQCAAARLRSLQLFILSSSPSCCPILLHKLKKKMMRW